MYTVLCRQFESVDLSVLNSDGTVKENSGKKCTIEINEISCAFEFAAYKYSPNQETSASSQVV